MRQPAHSFRETVEILVGRPLVILAAIVASLLLSLVAGQLGILLLYLVVLITLWATRWDWRHFGLTVPRWPETILKAFVFAIGIFVLNDFIVQPLAELYLGNINLSEVSGMEGNFLNLVLFIFLGWVLGGFCEEITYRGYVLRRLAIILGNTSRSWVFAAAIASVAFGLSHQYQGPAGVVSTGMIAFMLGIIFVFNKNNLMVLVLTHGIYNMIAMTLIYLGRARMVTDWVHGLVK